MYINAVVLLWRHIESLFIESSASLSRLLFTSSSPDINMINAAGHFEIVVLHEVRKTLSYSERPYQDLNEVGDG